MERKSGVLMHVSSLYGNYGIGSFGNEAKEFADFLAKCGFTYWQVLPFCPIDECNSPYKSSSTFGGNPYFINLDKLFEKGLVTQEERDSQIQQNPYSCEYGRLFFTRLPLLLSASKRVDNKTEIEEFINKRPHIKSFCEFMAKKHSNKNTPWYAWETEDFDEDILFMWKFIQYEFFCEWKGIKDYANSKGIKIIGDIPFYVDYDSSDVYYNKNMFKLNGDGKPSCVAGVPPDYFCPDGQLWGNPIYDWDYMKKEGFSWWRDRIGYMTELFDGIRIDHFRAASSYWEVPSDAKTAKEGTWQKGPGIDFVNAIKQAAGDKLIIAEDLGDITPDVYELLSESKFPGMRVFQFGFMGDPSSPHLPHNYSNNSVAYTGTHDNNTLLGYLWEMDDAERRQMLEYCGYSYPDWTGGLGAIIRTMFESHAGLLILPIQDLLGYGSDTRLNIPGKPEGNWQFRITREQLNGINTEYFRKLNKLYSR